MKNINIFVASIIILIGIAPTTAQILNQLQTNKFDFLEGKIILNENNSQIIELKHINTLEGQQDESQSEIMSGNIIIELNIESEYEYKVLLRNKFQNQLPEKFNNINGYHYIKVKNTYLNEVEIVLKKIIIQDEFEKANFKDDFKEDDQNEEEDLDQEEQYQIKIISLEQNYCPFNCHDNGICQTNGECQCNNGYDQDSNCLIKIDRYTGFSDELIKINSQNHEQQGWYYAGIYIGNLEFFQKNIDYEKFNNLQFKIVFNFYYEIKNQDSSHIFVLDHHNYFKCLQTQQYLGGDSYQATFTISSDDFEKIFHNNYLYGYTIIFGWGNAKNFSVSIEIENTEDDVFEQSLQFLICVLFSFIIFSILSIQFFKNKGNQTQYLLIIPSDNNAVHLSNKNMQKQIMQQIKIFEYKNAMNESDNSTYQQCSICLNTYENGDLLCKTQCDHIFHKQCLEIWLSSHQVCPQDRNVLLKEM